MREEQKKDVDRTGKEIAVDTKEKRKKRKENGMKEGEKKKKRATTMA